MARKRENVKLADELLAQAKLRIVQLEPFYRYLLLSQLDVVPASETDHRVKELATDGRKIYYNPDWVVGLTRDELVGALCHRVDNCALLHPWRGKYKDKERWKAATSIVVNDSLLERGMKLPAGCLVKPEYKQKGLTSSEEVYEELPEGEPPGGSGKGSGGGGSGTGDEDESDSGESAPSEYTLSDDFLEPEEGLDSAEGQALAREWESATRSAVQQAVMQGNLPAGLQRLVDEALRVRVDYKGVLARFMQQASKSDYSWMRPNKRYLSQGLMLPSLYSEACLPLALVIDTSGSVSETILSQFTAHVRTIVEQLQPERVYLLWADAAVAHAEVFERGDELRFEPKGGGGTDFRPAFEWIAEKGSDAACVVYLTDMCGTFPSPAPEIPTLWCATTDVQGPFGETVRIEEEEEML